MEEEKGKGMAKESIIVFFSYSSSTRKIARYIHELTGATLCEIAPEEAYPAVYEELSDQTQAEVKAGYLPRLKPLPEDLSAFEYVFVGSPNWWNTIAPPLATFLSEHDLSGKTIIPFHSHGGSGAGTADADIAKLCPESTITESFSSFGAGTAHTKQAVEKWLKKIGW